MTSAKRWVREIAGVAVLVPACWVDKDLDIIANVRVAEGAEILYGHQVQVTGRKIAYPHFVPFKKIGKQWTHEMFDNFLNKHFDEVMHLITSLLEPDELTLLARRDPQKGCEQAR